MNLPGFVLPKDCFGSSTWHELAAVLKWSFQVLIQGIYPSCRHDGVRFEASDAGRAVPPALLVQVRGDWSCYKQVFQQGGRVAVVSGVTR